MVGGGIDNEGALSVTSSTISGNSANQYGGGIFNDGSLTLTNSTVANNRAPYLVDGGGGIENYFSGTLVATNSTVSGNTSYYGGGIDNGFGVSVSLANTIVAGNIISTSGSGPDYRGNVSSDLGYNLIGNTAGSSGFSTANHDVLNVSPDLGPLQNNGGPTETMAIPMGSPAMGAASVPLAVDPTTQKPLAYDQRGPGYPRTVDGKVDIGAYELLPPSEYVDAAWTGYSHGTEVYFPGDPNPHYIGIDAFADIPDGINAASDGSDVYVAAGTYTLTANLDLDKSISLIGPNVGISPRNGGSGRVGEAIINGGASLPFTGSKGYSIILESGITSLTADGFTFTDFDGNVFQSSVVPVTTVNLEQNIFNTNNGGLFYKFDVNAATTFDVEDNLIENQSMTGANQCLSSWVTSPIATSMITR